MRSEKEDQANSNNEQKTKKEAGYTFDNKTTTATKKRTPSRKSNKVKLEPDQES